MSDRSYATRSVNRETASRIIAAILAASRRIGFEPAVAVVDAAGNLRSFERSDASSFLAVNIAIDKAFTAASFGLATHRWVDLLEDRGAAHLRHVPRVTAVAGGFPLFENEAVIGAVGISGGSWSQDQQAGEEALGSLGFPVPA